MADLTPRATKALIGVFQRLDKLVPCRRRGVRGDFFDHGIAFRQQRIDRRRHVFGFNVRKARQAGEIQ